MDTNIKYNEIPNIKIAVLGSVATGKTAIINRLVNNNFSIGYEPTLEVTNYTVLFNLNEYDVKNKTYVMLTLEDMFGINNPLLQSHESTITSSYLKEKRTEMSATFQKLMFTSVEKRDKLSAESEKKKTKNVNPKKDRNPKFLIYEQIFENDEKIERVGFIFVCDCNDQKSYEAIKTIIEKLHQIEKTNNLMYPKCIFINKIDKGADKKKLKAIITDLQQFKTKFKLEFYKTSALTNYGITESFRKFISKIHQQQVDQKQNEGVEDQENDDIMEDKVRKKLLNSLNRLHVLTN
jgi:GTPase SAR1 family protein